MLQASRQGGVLMNIKKAWKNQIFIKNLALLTIYEHSRVLLYTLL
jgi:hypothetical protein